MIPNVIHFIHGLVPHFGGRPFSLIHYLCIKSAYELNRPERINIFYAYQPTGLWWQKVLQFAQALKVQPPKEIFGNPLVHYAHRTDVLRLQVLIEHGGIYLDTDVICKKPFTDLLEHEFVIGQEGVGGKGGLCNAVLLSAKNSRFAHKWLEGFVNFRSKGHDKYWNEMAVSYPARIAPECAGHVHLEGYKSFHWPLYTPEALKQLFEGLEDFPEAYCHHLWESRSWEPYLASLTEDSIRKGTGYFARLARRFL
jgi:hypothetical protein